MRRNDQVISLCFFHVNITKINWLHISQIIEIPRLRRSPKVSPMFPNVNNEPSSTPKKFM